jgi:hypothetical protein
MAENGGRRRPLSTPKPRPAGDCLMCEVEWATGEMSRMLRERLQQMNPVTDPLYQRYFDRLISEDGTRRILRGEHKADA